MSAPRLGTITLGQTPRPDLLSMVVPQVPDGVACHHVGVLDGLTDAEITARFAPRLREHRMLTRLADGRAMEIDARAAEAGVQRALTGLEDSGCTAVVVLSTAVFRGLRARRAWLIEPDRILPGLVAGLAGPRKVGIVSPIDMPLDAMRRKWAALQLPPAMAVASPFDDGGRAVELAVQALQRAGADVVLMDAMAFVDRHRAGAAAAGLPVLMASDLVARVMSACVVER